ncbi:MAG: hypothetical protein WD894_22245 [Pirellulales bacterium]
MTHVPRNVILYGHERDLPKPISLRAGLLSLVFEAGDLRYVRLGEQEIIRRIYVAVRDHNWATIPMRISDLKIDSGDDRFTITYSADHQEREIDFHWDATIQGTPDGQISFSMQGHSRSTFKRNRIGFCVLHPPQCAGMLCRFVQEFGDIVEKPFPRLIAPAPQEDPFQEIREMSYQVADDVWAELKFEGDIFETEDQRNWIDGSYKTFCTPLRLPFPVKIEARTEVSQRVQLRLRTKQPVKVEPSQPSTPRLRIAEQALPLVAVGLTLAKHPHTERQIERLKALNLSHVQTELHLRDATARDDYLAAVDAATRIGAPLEIAVYLSSTNDAERELNELAGWIRPEHSIARWLVFQAGDKTTRPDVLDAARRVLQSRTPQAQFGGGSAAYFTELNRERRDLQAADVLCYSINPQVHAFDNTSLVENAQAIAYTVESARQLGGGRGVAISPVTLRPRFNPDATGAAAEPPAGTLPESVDPRQMSLFGAVWTLASVKAVAESGAASATYYETVGWLGVMECDEGSPAPTQFRSIAAGVFPLYHVFAVLSEFRGGELLRCESTQPLTVAALVLRKSGRLRIVIANLTPETQHAIIEGAGNGDYRLRRLDESNAIAAMKDPDAFRSDSGKRIRLTTNDLILDLPAYGLVVLDRG